MVVAIAIAALWQRYACPNLRVGVRLSFRAYGKRENRVAELPVETALHERGLTFRLLMF